MNNLVTLNQDYIPVTTSKVLSDRFGKVHRDVIRAIDNAMKDMDDEFRVRNFAQSSYTSEQNKTLPCYEMTRDGYAVVAMGFTGSDAMKWKVELMNQFNKMEEYIKSGAQAQISEADRIAEETALIEAHTAKAEAEQRMYAVQQKGAYDAVEHALRMAKLFNASIDINDLIQRDLAAIPAPIITDLKMKLAPQINQFGSLDLERSALANLLDEHRVDMTPIKFNAEVLRPLGMLTDSNEIVGSGLYFGANDVASSTKKTTQPRWFVSRFPELLEYVKTQLNVSL